jgi:hypothetical protein
VDESVTFVVAGERFLLAGGDYDELWTALGDAAFVTFEHDPEEMVKCLEVEDAMFPGPRSGVWEVTADYVPTLLVVLTDEVVAGHAVLRAMRAALRSVQARDA